MKSWSIIKSFVWKLLVRIKFEIGDGKRVNLKKEWLDYWPQSLKSNWGQILKSLSIIKSYIWRVLVRIKFIIGDGKRVNLEWLDNWPNYFKIKVESNWKRLSMIKSYIWRFWCGSNVKLEMERVSISEKEWLDYTTLF